PTLIFATGLTVIATVLFASGIVVDSISRRAKEQKRYAYIAQGSPFEASSGYGGDHPTPDQGP
ncbi:MAG: hypothetical protein WBN68_20670, partial [Sedimenticolaceae bacterium]